MEALAARVEAVPAEGLTAAAFIGFLESTDCKETTQKVYINNLKQFFAWMYYTGTRAPTRGDIILYRDYLRTEHDAITLAPELPAGWTYRHDSHGRRYKVQCAAATAALYLQTLRVFFTYTEEAGIYPNIAKGVKKPKTATDAPKKDALTAEEVAGVEASIMEAARAEELQAETEGRDRAGRIRRARERGLRLRAIYLLTVTAGLRTVEVSRANVRDLERRGDRARLRIWGKGHDEPDKVKPIASGVYQAIDEYLRSREDGAPANSPLFIATGNRSGGRRIAPGSIGAMLKEAMRTAGIDSPRITAHSLRHTAGRAVMRLTGKNIYITQKYMRHKSPATTEIYLADDTQEEEAAIAEELYSYYHQTEKGGKNGA